MNNNNDNFIKKLFFINLNSTYRNTFVTYLMFFFILLVFLIPFTFPGKSFLFNEEFIYFSCFLSVFFISWRFSSEMIESLLIFRNTFIIEQFLIIYGKKNENLKLLLDYKIDIVKFCFESIKLLEKVEFKLLFSNLLWKMIFSFSMVKFFSSKCLFANIELIISEFSCLFENSDSIENSIVFQNFCFTMFFNINLIFSNI